MPQLRSFDFSSLRFSPSITIAIAVAVFWLGYNTNAILRDTQLLKSEVVAIRSNLSVLQQEALRKSDLARFCRALREGNPALKCPTLF